MEEEKDWHARWIWAEKQDTSRKKDFQLVYFRREFHLADTAGCQLVVDVSADSRYRLFLNGESVAVGPCRGDGKTHYYEIVDLSDRLQEGGNILAAKVLHYEDDRLAPSAIMSAATGVFLLQGAVVYEDGRVIEDLSSNEHWKCMYDCSLTLLQETQTCVGGLESVDGLAVPHGWETIHFNSRHWQSAVIISETYHPIGGALTPWQLKARPIPAMYERQRSFVSLIRHKGVISKADIAHLLNGTRGLHVPAGTRLTLELDAGELTTGYLRFVMEGGKGSEISFLCSESYETEDGRKGVRDDPEGKVLRGNREAYLVSGNNEFGSESYETFLFRTFRFIQLDIFVANEPLMLHCADYRETGYPLEVKAAFACSDETLSPLWDNSLRTLQRCMHETYIDCPYYEQLQYSMDTRLQILFTYNVSGDDRLARKAIHDFHSSLLPGGMLQSRYPCNQPQVIPGFALHWIMMVYDHFHYWGDETLVRRYRPTIDAVLDWFGRRIGTDGLLKAAPKSYWSYVDWVDEWETSQSRGVPCPGRRGPLTVYNLMYADALHKAAYLHERTGRKDCASEYKDQASNIITAVKEQCWSSELQLFQDGPGLEQYSQHAQLWAILAGAVHGDEARRISIELMNNQLLLQVSYSMMFFLFRAMSSAGTYEMTFEKWDLWRDQVNLHMTTWLEDLVSERSDCHAWGAVPLYEFPCEILGVKSGGIGFSRLVIEPKLGSLTWAEGAVVTPHGVVSVSWHKDGENGKFHIDVKGLHGIPTEIRLPDGTVHEYEGRNEAEIESFVHIEI
ncbi:alpha-L-rhamnosidase-related protein [Paenibacillus eucommiae]|uniref:Alpha-L-rhamnosidase n=1 Tax=Paenibacillus eucommiae TaxID=1355755 RepID=A0ABS4IMG1_9BACL|nr:alpha-L-rhamnosidase C-terminal domain-containing protein [Paenibacillus eucommiae]MBP1988757.1 hypothetical protein [Paenibacillus eucommiae]